MARIGIDWDGVKLAVLAAYAAGATTRKIGLMLGCSGTMVARKLEEWGVARRGGESRSRPHNLVGKRYGRLFVFAKAHGSSPPRWWVRCDCGKKKIMTAAHLSSGRFKSCGCGPRGRRRSRTSPR